MTHQLDPAKLLAIALYKLGEPLLVSEELYLKMKPVNVLATEDNGYIRLTVTSSELLVGTVDNDEVEVVL